MGTYLPKQADQTIAKEKSSNTDEGNFVLEMFCYLFQFVRKTGALTKKKKREAGERHRFVIYSDETDVLPDQLFTFEINACDLTGLTIGELWVAELQVFACPGRVVLRTHGVLHALDVLFEVVEWAEDVLHALAVVHDGGVRLHVTGALGLLGWLDGQGLDYFTWWAL